MKNKECFYSSLIFLTSALLAYKHGNTNYSLSFIFLVITSLIHHYYFNCFTRNLDRVAILIVFYYTVLSLFNKSDKIKSIHKIFFVMCFLFTFYIFGYGYFTKQYSFDTNYRNACLWHSLLHLICCCAFNILITI
jgi:hypothetical protein